MKEEFVFDKERFDFVMYERMSICRKTDFFVYADSREEAERIVREADENGDLEGCYGYDINLDDREYLYDTAERMCDEEGYFEVSHYGEYDKPVISR